MRETDRMEEVRRARDRQIGHLEKHVKALHNETRG